MLFICLFGDRWEQLSVAETARPGVETPERASNDPPLWTPYIGIAIRRAERRWLCFRFLGLLSRLRGRWEIGTETLEFSALLGWDVGGVDCNYFFVDRAPSTKTDKLLATSRENSGGWISRLNPDGFEPVNNFLFRILTAIAR